MYSMELVNWLVGLKTSVTMDASSQYEISSWFLKLITKAFKEKRSGPPFLRKMM